MQSSFVTPYATIHSMELRLKELREMRDLTQDEVADTLHSTKATISRLESGKMRINSDWIDKFCGLYQCRIPDLFVAPTPPWWPEIFAEMAALFDQEAKKDGSDLEMLPIDERIMAYSQVYNWMLKRAHEGRFDKPPKPLVADIQFILTMMKEKEPQGTQN